MILGMTCAPAMLSLWMDGGMLCWQQVHMRLSMDCGRSSGRRAAIIVCHSGWLRRITASMLTVLRWRIVHRTWGG